MKAFRVSVVAPAKPQYEFEAECVTVPAETGALGVMYGHLPLLTTLKVGIVTIREATGKDHLIAITGGFFEMMGDHAVVLADDLIDESEASEPVHLSAHRPQLIFPAEFPSAVARSDFARALLRRRLELTGRLRPSPTA